MELPTLPPSAVLPSAVLPASPPLSSPPPSSPFPSRPPSPSRVSYAYPPSSRDTSIAPTIAPPSRSGSHSKLLRPRRDDRAKGLKSFFTNLLGANKSTTSVNGVELENRGRRMSNGLEAATGEVERERRARGTELASATTTEGDKGPWWRMSRERAQLVVSFAIIALVGMNDSATGANLDRMQEFYDTTYDKISLVFLANTAGYLISSMGASFVLHHFGLQVALLVACAGMVAGCTMLIVAPPFAVFISSLVFLGFGSGMYDACITTIISHEEDANLMSFTYAMFGIGAFVSPLLIGGFIDRGVAWNFYYAIPMGISLILAVVAFFTFRGYQPPPDETHDEHTASTDDATGAVVHGRAVMSASERMKRALRIRAVWVGFLLVAIAFGSSDTLSAWVVSFMVQKRSAPAAASRYMLSGVWAGIAVGRVALPLLLSKRFGERTFAIVLLGLASAMLAIMYVKSWAVDAVAMALVGAFLGPVTPRVLSAVGARVPPSLKGSVIGLTIGIGLIGSSVGPLLFGVVAGRGGLSTLPAVLIGASLFSVAGWSVMPKNRRRED